MDQYVVFTVYKQSFAINISSIERVIEFQEPKKAPEASDYFLGVIQYSGRILPIIDLSMRLYQEACINKEDPKVIVALWKENYIGFQVDDVIGVRTFTDNQFEEANKDINISQHYVSGFIKEEDDIIIVLDVSKIFVDEQEEELLLAIEG